MPEEITMDSIVPEEFRDHASLRDIKSPEALVKSFVHSQKLIGEKNYLPKEGDAPEAVDAFFSKIGWTPAKDDYKIPFGENENLKPLQEKMRDAFYEARIPLNQAVKVGTAIDKTLAEALGAEKIKTDETNQAMRDKIDGLFKGDKEKVMARVGDTLQKFIPEELKDDFVGLDDNTKNAFSLVVDGFIKEYGGEDFFVGKKFGAPATSESSAEVRDAMKKLQGEMSKMVMFSEPYNEKAKEYSLLIKKLDSIK
jgi:hypothetical protein